MTIPIAKVVGSNKPDWGLTVGTVWRSGCSTVRRLRDTRMTLLLTSSLTTGTPPRCRASGADPTPRSPGSKR